MESLTRKSYLEMLPPEMKIMIMGMLSRQDLCNLALTCKNLRAAALDPGLWTEFTLTLTKFVMDKLETEGVDSLVLHWPRFQNVKSLNIFGCCQQKKFKVGEDMLLESLTFQSVQKQDVVQELICKAIAKVKKVNLNGSCLSRKQLLAILTESIQHNSFTELNLGELQWNEKETTFEVFSRMMNMDLKDAYGFKAGSNSLVSIPSNLLSKLKNVNLSRSCSTICLFPIGCHMQLQSHLLTTEQLSVVFKEIIKSNNLGELNLSSQDLQNVPTSLLRNAISKRTKVNLTSTQLSTEQLKAILEGVIESKSLTVLNLSLNDLKNIPKELLSKAISKLENVNLSWACLTTEQIVAILEKTINSNSLKELILSFNYMETVPSQLLSKAISKLTKVQLCMTSLSKEQIVAILEESIRSDSINELNLNQNTISLKDLPAELVDHVMTKMKIVLGEFYKGQALNFAIKDEHRNEKVIKSNSFNTKHPTIRVVDEGSHNLRFKIKATNRMESLKKSYFNNTGTMCPEMDKLSFFLNERRINDNDSPNTLEMEQDDIIEVLHDCTR